jgi:hypothetical protein
MPKLTCACGTVIDLSVIPSPFGLKLVPEAGWEAMVDRVKDALHSAIEWRSFRAEVFGFGNSAIRQAYVCPACGRLYVFDTPSSSEPSAVWTLERGDASRLLERDDSDAETTT